MDYEKKEEEEEADDYVVEFCHALISPKQPSRPQTHGSSSFELWQSIQSDQSL